MCDTSVSPHSDDHGLSVACSVRTPAPIGVSLEATPPRRRPTHDWDNHRDGILRSDVEADRAAQDKRRTAASRRLKHRWSAVKLARTGEDNKQYQASTVGHTAVERFRALSPASQEALLQLRERRSSIGTHNTVQPEFVRSTSPEVVPAESSSFDKDSDAPNQPNGRVQGHRNSSGVQNLRAMFEPSDHTVKQSPEFKDAKLRSPVTEAIAVAYEQGDVSTLSELLNLSEPSQQYTTVPSRRRRQDTVKQDRRYHAEQDIGSVQQQQKPVQGSNIETNIIDSLKNKASCGGWNSAEVPVTEPKSDIFGKGGRWSKETHNIVKGFQNAAKDSMRREGGFLRYSSDGSTSSFDTLSFHNSDASHDTEVALGLGLDSSKFLERRMRANFGDDWATPIRYTPSAGTDNGFLPEQSVNGANPTSREPFEHTVEGIEEAEPCTAPRQPGQTHSQPSEMSIEQAMHILNVQDYLSVDIGLLQERLKRQLSCGDADRVNIANAFTAIIKHQDRTGSWILRLRWNDDFDGGLFGSHQGTQHDDWSSTAHDLGTTQEDCRQRWATLKPEDWKPNLVCKCAATESLECCCCLGANWTLSMDEKLMSLKADNCSWRDIAKHFNLGVAACTDRHKQIKPEDWEPTPKPRNQTKKEQHKGARKETGATNKFTGGTADEKPTAELAKEGTCGCKNGNWCTGLCESFCQDCGQGTFNCTCRPPTVPTGDNNPAGRSRWDLIEDCRLCGLPVTQCACILDVPKTRSCGYVDHGWFCDCGNSWGRVNGGSCPFCGAVNGCTVYAHCGVLSYHTATKAEPAPFNLSEVTYWVTVESAGKEIHIPIADKHVSGPEKSVVTDGMQKVWKWVHDKGLGDKVGLQDAFDLAQSMHKEEIIEEVEDPRVKTGAGSNSSHRTGSREYGLWSDI